MPVALRIELDNETAAYRPGEIVSGRLHWDADDTPKQLEISLLWYTSGKGDRDTEVLETVRVPQPRRSGEHDFGFRLPPGPYSFSGRLITLSWAIEAVASPSDDTDRADFFLSPTGKEIRLQSVPGYEA